MFRRASWLVSNPAIARTRTSIRPPAPVKSLRGSFPLDIASNHRKASHRYARASFNEGLDGIVQVAHGLEDKVGALLVDEVAAFLGIAQIFESIGYDSRHAGFLNLCEGSMNQIGLLDARFEFEPDSYGALACGFQFHDVLRTFDQRQRERALLARQFSFSW